ncbi:N-6 DNA methylase [Bilifractor sp. LCP19S3_H10]|uniref:N-6 DNA methylase n=1 Tax=Bilifractor sp. LCP19S3_H10 TaxID=3438736 RepID=UPI003F8F5F1F
MAKTLTEDAVRDKARDILGLKDKKGVRSGVGQLTTFNQLGFSGVADKPDGWYLPENHADTAIVLETKASKIVLGKAQVNEVLKNVRIVQTQYEKVVGVLYNGEDVRVFKGTEEYEGDGAKELHNVEYYTDLFKVDHIDKEHIYELTAKINNCLHFEFGIKNLYHRMIFTACALVAKRYDALMVKGMDYSMFTNAIQSSIGKALIRDKQQNQKLELLLDVFSEIRMNLNVNSEDEKEQKHVKDLIGQFIEWITEISDCLNSDAWRGEDVMGIFFNEFNRYKKKSEAGQVFTPEHITDFMYRILEVNKDDRVLDNVPAHTQCAFILPDKKLEKASKTQIKRILKNHRLRKVIKLPEGLFFGVDVTTSIFVFEAGVAQDGKEFFACYMESDGLATVKNKGRHDVYGKWADIEAHWVDVIEKQSGDDTCQWLNPAEHLSYQMPQKPFEIFEEDFRKTVMDYLMFQKGIDAKAFGEKLLDTAMYSSRVSAGESEVTISLKKGGESNGED